MLFNQVKLLTVVVALSAITACGGAEPLPQSDCDKIVTHVKKVLGKFAPAHGEMLNNVRQRAMKRVVVRWLHKNQWHYHSVIFNPLFLRNNAVATL